MRGLGIRQKASRLIADVPGLQRLFFKFRRRSSVFDKAYRTDVWGSTESHSGKGSELGATESLRLYLPEVFDKLNVKTLLDAPCGDWNWMRKVDLSSVQYVGADVVHRAIERNKEKYKMGNVDFIVADLTKDKLQKCDLVLCRDCWVHLSFQDISDILGNFRRSGSKYLLVNDSPNVKENTNKTTGLSWRHINLSLPPFNFPPPIESIKDNFSDSPFFISLWRIEDLPAVTIR